MRGLGGRHRRGRAFVLLLVPPVPVFPLFCRRRRPSFEPSAPAHVSKNNNLYCMGHTHHVFQFHCHGLLPRRQYLLPNSPQCKIPIIFTYEVRRSARISPDTIAKLYLVTRPVKVAQHPLEELRPARVSPDNQGMADMAVGDVNIEVPNCRWSTSKQTSR